MSSRVAGAGCALLAAALLAMTIATPLVLPGQLALFSGHPTIGGRTQKLKDVYVGVLGAQLCNTGGDGRCASGGDQEKPAFRAAGYGTLGASGVVMVSSVLLAVFALQRNDRRKLMARVIQIASLPALGGAIAMLQLGPFREATVPIGILGVVLFGAAILNALIASVLAALAEQPLKLRVGELGASDSRDPRMRARRPSQQPVVREPSSPAVPVPALAPRSRSRPSQPPPVVAPVPPPTSTFTPQPLPFVAEQPDAQSAVPEYVPRSAGYEPPAYEGAFDSGDPSEAFDPSPFSPRRDRPSLPPFAAPSPFAPARSPFAPGFTGEAEFSAPIPLVPRTPPSQFPAQQPPPSAQIAAQPSPSAQIAAQSPASASSALTAQPAPGPTSVTFPAQPPPPPTPTPSSFAAQQPPPSTPAAQPYAAQLAPLPSASMSAPGYPPMISVPQAPRTTPSMVPPMPDMDPPIPPPAPVSAAETAPKPPPRPQRQSHPPPIPAAKPEAQPPPVPARPAGATQPPPLPPARAHNESQPPPLPARAQHEAQPPVQDEAQLPPPRAQHEPLSRAQNETQPPPAASAPRSQSDSQPPPSASVPSAPRPQSDSQAPPVSASSLRAPLRAAVPMPARTSPPTRPPAGLPVPARTAPATRPPGSSTIVPPIVTPGKRPIPPMAIPMIPPIPGLPKQLDTDPDGAPVVPPTDEPGDADRAGAHAPIEVGDSTAQTDAVPAIIHDKPVPAGPVQSGSPDEAVTVPDRDGAVGDHTSASSVAAPAVRDRPLPKLPISTAPDSLPPPKETQSTTSGPSPACPQCESPMTWVEEHLRFYCKSCRMYF